MTQSDYITGIDQRVADADSRLTTAIKQACLAQALAEYNKRRPREIVAEVIGDGAAFLALPTGWQTGFSELRRVEYFDDDYLEAIPAQEWQVIQNPSPEAESLFFLTTAHSIDDTTYRLTYTVAHTIGVSSSTVPSGDDAALMDCAASHAALRLAAAHFDNIDPTIGSVSVDNKTRADYYNKLAKDLQAGFEAAMKDQDARGMAHFKTWARNVSGVFQS
jgi:hypothetical protein